MTEPLTITKILVPLDGSELAEIAIPYAIAIADPTTQIVLLEVLPKSEPVRDLLGRVTLSEEDTAIVEKLNATDSLTKAAERWATLLKTKPTLTVVQGDPADMIIQTGTDLGCDFIVSASRGQGAVKRLAFGSVADRLARASTVPVMIVRPGDALAEVVVPELSRIVVPYDGSELADEALPVAASLASRVHAPVHLIRVISPTASAPTPMPMEPYYPTAAYEEIFEEIEKEAQSSLDSGKAILGETGTTVTSETAIGSPAAAIEELTKPGDLIVMTSHGRSGFKRWLIGSVAEQLVREGSVPVVLVPSKGRAETA